MQQSPLLEDTMADQNLPVNAVPTPYYSHDPLQFPFEDGQSNVDLSLSDDV